MPATLRLYDRLFTEPQPDAGGRDFREALNPASLSVVQGWLEPSLAAVAAEQRFQFERHGYFIADRPIEFVTCRVQSVGEVPKPPVIMYVGGPSIEQARIGSRPIYIDARHGWQDSAIYERTRLPAAATVHGPCVINEMSATTIVLPGQSASVDPHGNIILQVAP